MGIGGFGSSCPASVWLPLLLEGCVAHVGGSPRIRPKPGVTLTVGSCAVRGLRPHVAPVGPSQRCGQASVTLPSTERKEWQVSRCLRCWVDNMLEP